MAYNNPILLEHLALLLDRKRVDAFEKAISSIVKPGDVVLDLGCGSGILTLFSCQSGAKTVYAIDSGDVIELARKICEMNGCTDRVEFFHAESQHVEIPERVDVVIAEVLGDFGIGENILSSVIDARTRFLKPGGVIIPNRVDLMVVPVESPRHFDILIDFWVSKPYIIDFSPFNECAANSPFRVKFDESELIGNSETLVSLDLMSETKSGVASKVSCRIIRDGVLHGIAGWFDAHLTSNIQLSNAPPLEASCWKQVFFPLERPVEVITGDIVHITIESARNDHLLRWVVDVEGSRPDRSDEPILLAHSDQGGLKGFPLAGDWMKALFE